MKCLGCSKEVSDTTVINGYCFDCLDKCKIPYSVDVQQGWQCPVCKRIFSPMTFMCYFCSKEKE